MKYVPIVLLLSLRVNNNAPIASFIRTFMSQNLHIHKAFDVFLYSTFSYTYLIAILSAVIDGSEITRSIIFCAVLLTFFGVFDVSPNLFAFTPNFSTEHP